MRGRTPKTAALRQRVNRASTIATLAPDTTPQRMPSLPRDREWRTETRDWWFDVWHSPLISEFIQVDRHGLVLLADLIDKYWSNPSITQAMGLAAEIRQQGVRFGLSPIDRRRLQWEVRRVAPAAAPPAEPSAPPAEDPRRALMAV